MKIIVTGGAGFIASHIVDAYVKAGHRVAVIDDLSSGFKKNLNPQAKFYKADIRNAELMHRIFGREKPEILNHHAALIEVAKSLREPRLTIETNVLGTLNVALAFVQHGRGRHRKIIFASTGGAIYGEPQKIPADEKTPPAPLSSYALSKLLGEEMIKFYADRLGLNYLILRYANVYGPRQNPRGEAGVVAIFSELMKNGVRPTIFGDGTKARDYVYVGDIVRANFTALKKGCGTTLNFGWGKRIMDQTIFDTIAKETQFEGKPIYAPYRKGEVYQIALNARRAKKILGWRPKIKLRDGVRKTLAAL